MLEGRQGQNCLFLRGDYRTKVTAPKTALGPSAGENDRIVKFPRSNPTGTLLVN
jgi:hypothetical protein